MLVFLGSPFIDELFYLLYRLHPLGECSRNPSVSVYQLVLLWEVVFNYSEFFFENSTNLHISWWVIYECTCSHLNTLKCSVVFGQKWHDPHAPPSLFTKSHPKRVFLSPWLKKVLKGKHFADVEEVKQKMAEALKGINNDEFKNYLRSGKNTLIAVVHQMESTLKVTEI